MNIKEVAKQFNVSIVEVEKFLAEVEAANPKAYSVQLTDRQPGETEDSLNAVVTYYGDEPGAAANRSYVRF